MLPPALLLDLLLLAEEVRDDRTDNLRLDFPLRRCGHATQASVAVRAASVALCSV